MFKMEVPYDKRIMQISLEDKNLAGVLVGRQGDYVSDKSEKEIVEESLDHVIGSQTLEELAKGKKDIVIISSDHTRPVPSKIITPILLRRIRSVSPDARIRILVATGFHRPSTKEELIDKYGKEIVENEEIVMHIAKDDNSMKKIGTLPSGGACIINKIAADADLLIAADCTAYAYANFHQDFIKGKITLIGCPKLDSVDYSEKLTEIIRQNNIKSVTIVRMEVPCCGGIQNAAINAMKASGKFLPWQVYTISTDGRILA